MAELARSGTSEGLWLRAERQTSGKGRQGRAWDSPAGNLYISTLVRVRPGEPSPATLALVAAVALEEAVSLFGVHPMLKWPNDLLVDGGYRSAWSEGSAARRRHPDSHANDEQPAQNDNDG